jgi:hypothetical protein
MGADVRWGVFGRVLGRDARYADHDYDVVDGWMSKK